jgi:flagellar hook-basal body complex protein FliE
MTTPTIAANSYAALQRLIPNDPLKDSSPKAGGGSFGEMLEGALNKFTAQGHEVDAKAKALAMGKGDVVDVVTAVADSEDAVQTLVSVRDKMISAYEEIMRMPI